MRSLVLLVSAGRDQKGRKTDATRNELRLEAGLHDVGYRLVSKVRVRRVKQP